MYTNLMPLTVRKVRGLSQTVGAEGQSHSPFHVVIRNGIVANNKQDLEILKILACNCRRAGAEAAVRGPWEGAGSSPN